MSGKKFIRITLITVCPLLSTEQYPNERQRQCERVGSQAFYRTHNEGECHENNQCLVADVYPEVVQAECHTREYRIKYA